MKDVMIVVGAGQISMAIARRMGAGKKIILGDKNIENAKNIQKTMVDAGFDVEVIEMDLSSRQDILKMIDMAKSYGPIKMLVNGAGVSPSQAPIEAILKVNLYGTAVLLEEVGKKDLIKKLRKYFKDEEIFEYYNINSQIERALDRKVYLDSGAYIIIEKTEALISIDVNTGQNIGNKTSQELIFQTNLEATKEIARQIKLRNLAGIIIVDFIDMKKFSDRKRVLEEFKKYLSEDKAEKNSVEYTNLGLIQFTRKRQGKELAFYYKEKCQYCEGTGYFLSKERIILNLLEDLNSQIKSQDIKKIEIRAKKGIIKELSKYIDNNKIEYIEDNNFYKIGYKMELYS